MLVLSRELDQEIVAGDIRIRVVRIEGKKVRLGITAPREVPVDRAEIHERKKKQE